METIKTNLHVKELFKKVTDLAPGLYEGIKDFIDEAIRQKYTRVLEYAIACAQMKASRT